MAKEIAQKIDELAIYAPDTKQAENSLIGQLAINELQSSFLEGSVPTPEQLHPYVNTMLLVLKDTGINYSVSASEKTDLPSAYLMKKLHRGDLSQNPYYDKLSKVYDRLYPPPEINIYLKTNAELDYLTGQLRSRFENASVNWARLRTRFKRKTPDTGLDGLKLKNEYSNISYDGMYAGYFRVQEGQPVQTFLFNYDKKTDMTAKVYPQFAIERDHDDDLNPVLNFELQLYNNNYGNSLRHLPVFRLKFSKIPDPENKQLSENTPLSEVLECSDTILQSTYNHSFFNFKLKENGEAQAQILDFGEPDLLESEKIFRASSSIRELFWDRQRNYRRNRFAEHIRDYTKLKNRYQFYNFTPDQYFKIITNLVLAQELNPVRFWKKMKRTGFPDLIPALNAATDRDRNEAMDAVLKPDAGDLEIARIMNFDKSDLDSKDGKEAEILYDLALFLKLNPQIVGSLPENQKNDLTRVLAGFRPGTQRVTEALKTVTKGFFPEYHFYYGQEKEAGLLNSIILFDLVPERISGPVFYRLPEWANTFEKREARKWDMYFMQKALELARLSYEENFKKDAFFQKLSPVGCVIVDRNRKIVAEAVNEFRHGRQLHAEIIALEKAAVANGGSLDGCTVYSSYEFCDGCGRTLLEASDDLAGVVWSVCQKTGAQTQNHMFSNPEYQSLAMADGKRQNPNFRYLGGIREQEAYDFYVNVVGWDKGTLKPD